MGNENKKSIIGRLTEKKRSKEKSCGCNFEIEEVKEENDNKS